MKAQKIVARTVAALAVKGITATAVPLHSPQDEGMYTITPPQTSAKLCEELTECGWFPQEGAEEIDGDFYFTSGGTKGWWPQAVVFADGTLMMTDIGNW